MVAEVLTPAPIPMEERRPKVETEQIKQMMTPVRARILASTVDGKYLDPQREINQESANLLPRNITERKPSDINYKAIEELSKESSASYWKDKGGRLTFKQKNDKWNASVHGWINEQLQDRRQNPDDFIDALGAVNIKIDRDNREADYSQQIESFRIRYFGENGEKRNVRQFVSDIANDCKADDSDNAPVDLGKLQTRLAAVRELFNSFGLDKGVNDLVEDYIAAHALLSQNEEKRKEVAEAVAEHIQKPLIADSEKSARNRLQALYEKQQGLPEDDLQRRQKADDGEKRKIKNEDRGEQAVQEERVEINDLHPAIEAVNGDTKAYHHPNEDAMFINRKKGVFGIFDGATMSEAGAIAATTAKEYIAEQMEKLLGDLPRADEITDEKLREIIIRANQRVSDEVNKHSKSSGQTTASLVIICEGADRKPEAITVSVGNTFIYRFRLLNEGKGDSILEKLAGLDQGALGTNIDDPKLVIKRHKINPGDRLLIASDGIYKNLLVDNELLKILNKNSDPNTAVTEITEAAWKNAEEKEGFTYGEDDMSIIDIRIR